MSNRSDAVSCAGLAVAHSWYAYEVFSTGIDQPDLLARTIEFWMGAIVILALVHIVVALIPGKPPLDKAREREIGRSSGRNAYVAVCAVMWAAPFLIAIPAIGQNLGIVLSVVALGLAETVRYGSRLIYRGLGAGRNHSALAA